MNDVNAVPVRNVMDLFALLLDIMFVRHVDVGVLRR